MNYVKRIAPPSVRPVSLDEAKIHVKVSGTSEDSVLAIYLDAAIAASENKLQTAIMNTEFTLYAETFQQRVSLQKKWVSGINSVKYYDSSGTQTTVSPANYILQDFRVPNVLCFNNDYTFPSTDSRDFPVEINFQAGALAATGVIPNIRDAVFLEFADRYENRQGEVTADRIELIMFNKTAEAILTQECLWL